MIGGGRTCAGPVPEQETTADYRRQQTRGVSPTWDPLAPTRAGRYPASIAPDRTVPLTEVLSRLKDALADRYVIERELGSGGMATVYLAEDLRHHRQVAVKVLRPELAGLPFA